MTTPRPRRRVLQRTGVALISGIGLTGCLGEAPTGDNDTTTTHSETTKVQTATPNSETEVPLAEISDEDAKARALAAEEAYLETRLQNATCLLSWGTTPTTASKEATVVERSADGVVVDVTHPYWYGKENEEADSVSEAFYLVNETSVERTSGDDISPC
ncbi:hypothetical protein GJR96_09830 [Haloferax sp. MBLA0076]|uniref:Lipoprotein n=1 Tax=Haloferax litoreum TaxID=2666140 RepID=A0A6A8GIG2_9EURY|nr:MULTISPECIES: hypothetical protein [Haloferax]KAB1193721.1 hypothetical protein Hfx1148_09805 [Haloferax sp. CBA1148]MRX22252.1 hypothetical protein [Haloferax litoreum]